MKSGISVNMNIATEVQANSPLGAAASEFDLLISHLSL